MKEGASPARSGGRPIRMLHVIGNLGLAGAEISLAYLLPKLRRLGCEIEVVTLTPPDDLIPLLEAEGIPVHQLRLQHEKDYAHAVPQISRVLSASTFDIAHAHLIWPTLYLGAVSFIHPDVSFVVSFDNLAYDSYPPNTIRRRSLKSATGWLLRHRMMGYSAVSTAVAEHYSRHLNLKNVEVIPNAIDINRIESLKSDGSEYRRRLHIAPDEFVVLMPSRLVKEKGHEFMLRAAEIMKTSADCPLFLTVGDGPLSEKLRDEIENRSLGDRVRMLPRVSHEEVFRVMCSSDVVLICSTHEGFGIAGAEAMLMERAVIASAVGGLVDLVEDGVSGLLLPPKDPQAIVNALRTLRSNAQLRSQLAAGGSRRVRQIFDVEVVAAKWLRFYENVLSQRDQSSSQIVRR